MINSNMIVSTMRYKINNLTPNNCTTLLNIIDKKLTSDECKKKLDLLFIDNTLDATTNEDNLNIVVTSYVTQKEIKSIIKNLRAFIDNNLSTIEQKDFTATMLMRRVY